MPAARIPRTVIKAKPKPNLRTSRSHQDFIRSLPCLGCGRAPQSEQAHVRTGTDGGTGLRPSDRYSVPLCAPCHRTGPKAQHTIGEPAFWSAKGIDPGQVAERLWTVSGDHDQGLRTILRALAGKGQK
jgi:hypothetical protein